MEAAQLSELLGVTREEVRYYTRNGYLKPGIDVSRRTRDYTQSDLQRLRFVLSAQQLGFTLNEISEILEEAEKGAISCPRIRGLIEQRLEEFKQREADTRALHQQMKETIQQWRARHKPLTGNALHHLIEDFAPPPEQNKH